jgi:hypothetical protein
MDQMKNIGYTSNNCSNNLGTMYLTLMVYLFQVVFTICLAIVYKTTGKGEKLLRKMESSLFFTGILVMSIEGYMEFYITGYIQVTNPVFTTFGESHAVYLGWFLLVIAFVFLPGSLIWTLVQKKETLEKPEFESRWGPCYAEISLRNKWSRAYYIFYIGRRFLYISIGIFIVNPTY